MIRIAKRRCNVAELGSTITQTDDDAAFTGVEKCREIPPRTA